MAETTDRIEGNARLAALLQHEGWHEFILRSNDKVKANERHLLFELRSDIPVADLQRRVDYNRGFEDALEWAMKLAFNAENRVERYLKESSV